MAVVHARAAEQGADVFGAAAGSPGASRLVAGRRADRCRALSCGPAPRVGGGLDARPRASAARARLPQRSSSAHPRAWRVSCQRLGGPKEECSWGAVKAEEERAAAEEEEELAGVGACALGVIGNVLEAAIFEQSDEFDCEADSELDDSDAEEASSSLSTSVSAAPAVDEAALARLAESKLGVDGSYRARPQELLLSGCNTPSLIDDDGNDCDGGDDDDDFEEVLSLASDDAFDEACYGERARIYMQAAMRVAKGATDGALEEEYGFREETSAGAPTIMAVAASSEGPEAEGDDDDDGDRSTIAPADEVQEVFQETVLEDVAFDCVCELVDEGLSCAGAPAAAPRAPRAAEVKAAPGVSHKVAPDVGASRPELTPLMDAPAAPEVASSAPEPATLAESPGDAPEQAPAAPAFEAPPTASASKISPEATGAAAIATAAAPAKERAPQTKAAATRPPAPTDEDWSAILEDLQREAAAQPPTPAAPVKPAKPIMAKGAVRPVRGADRPPAAPHKECAALPAPAPARPVVAKPAAAAAEPEMGAGVANPGTAAGNKPTAGVDAPPAAPSHPPQAGPPMSASRSRRRIIGGVVRAPVEVERGAAMGAGAFKKGMLGGPGPTMIQRQQVPQKASATMFRLDRHDGNTADPASNAAARESSLTKGYDALGVEFHRLDEDDWRRGAFGRQPSQGSLARGPSALGSLAPMAAAPRLKGPLGAASALVLDLGEGAASSWNRTENVQGRPPLNTLDALGRSASSSGLRVTKALPSAVQAAGASRTSSGSLAWSMRMARSAAKRNGLAEAF